MDSRVTAMRELVERYMGQLVHGCGEPSCTEVLCRTGRENTATSGRPLRPFTVRSARAIAITYCSDIEPRRHLCPYYSPKPNHHDFAPDGPRDPSSLVQLVCDTDAFRQLQFDDSRVAPEERAIHAQLEEFNSQLNARLIDPNMVALFRNNDSSANDKIADFLCPAIEFLLAQISTHRLASLQFVDREFVSKGLAAPQRFKSTPSDDTFNTWLQVLDVLRKEPFQRLFCHIIKLLSLRRRIERSGHNIADVLVKRLLTGESTPARSLALVIWLKRLFLNTWDGKVLLQRGTINCGTLDFLMAVDALGILPPETFHLPLISARLDAFEAVKSFLESSSSSTTKYLFHMKFLFNPDEKALYFRLINHLGMRKASSESEIAESIQRTSGGIRLLRLPEQLAIVKPHYLLLNIRRGQVLEDAFNQLWHRSRSELRLPLRIRLGEDDVHELGQDLGGVQIEFFNLVAREAIPDQVRKCEIEIHSANGLVDTSKEMFAATEIATGCSYFQPGSLQPLHTFECFGSLFALALYNGITLPVCFPKQLYYGLFLPDQPATTMQWIERIEDDWPTIAKSMSILLAEHVDGLEWTYTVEINGLTLTVLMLGEHDEEPKIGNPWRVLNLMPATDTSGSSTSSGVSGLPRGQLEDMSSEWPGLHLERCDQKPIAVTSENRADYIRAYCQWLTIGSVAPQVHAFQKGFRSTGLFDEHTLQLLGPEGIKNLIEGSDELDINELKAVAKYEGYDPRHQYIRSFWQIVSGWPQPKQKQLLKFVTAIERVPVGGVSRLKFVISRAASDLPNVLPTSSTCFGTLFLPRYSNEQMLARQLSLAVEYGCEGFGMG